MKTFHKIASFVRVSNILFTRKKRLNKWTSKARLPWSSRNFTLADLLREVIE